VRVFKDPPDGVVEVLPAVPLPPTDARPFDDHLERPRPDEQVCESPEVEAAAVPGVIRKRQVVFEHPRVRESPSEDVEEEPRLGPPPETAGQGQDGPERDVEVASSVPEGVERNLDGVLFGGLGFGLWHDHIPNRIGAL